jgi:hypothetical protein
MAKEYFRNNPAYASLPETVEGIFSEKSDGRLLA